MAKKDTNLKKFEAVALEKDKARQIRGGSMDLWQGSYVESAPNFVGWGEIEIRTSGFSVMSLPGSPHVNTSPVPLKRGR